MVKCNTSKHFFKGLCNHSNGDFLVTMVTPISSHVKNKNSIFTARD